LSRSTIACGNFDAIIVGPISEAGSTEDQGRRGGGKAIISTVNPVSK